MKSKAKKKVQDLMNYEIANDIKDKVARSNVFKFKAKIKPIEERFIPTTKEIEVAKNIVYRPIRSWHGGVYAGEKLTERNGDHSGCMSGGVLDGSNFHSDNLCHIPYTYTHRLYWHKQRPQNRISAFLSYPDAMGMSDGEYFWEVLGIDKKHHDIKRFFGSRAETAMEKAIIKNLTPILPKKGKRK